MAEFYSPKTEDSDRRLRETARKTVETKINQVSACIQKGDFDNSFYRQTCMNLGSNIDAAIAMNEAPSSYHMHQLLLIVKEVYRRKTEPLLPSLMFLMLPIKAACEIGWFPDKDKDALLMVAKEVSYEFSNTDKMSSEPDNAEFYVSSIISRFYPKLKVESILTSLVVKAGYGCFAADFHISMGTLPRHHLNLWLLVARIDNMDTAACIASPSDVDFLINGSGVPKRTKSDMGKGPQLPSNVTKRIKPGVNLLQIFGNFDGSYIIAVAFMSLISSPDPPQLHDHANPKSDEVDSDCSVNGTPSRISLECPISQCRIRTPVKGHLCKHPQCFDYEYFMETNSIRPTWKCPVCKMPVCNVDIRIDRNFVKILNEVVGCVRDVIISPDGSWTAVMPEMSQATATNTNINTMSQNTHVIDTTPGRAEQAQKTTIFTPVQLTPSATGSPHIALGFKQLRKRSEEQPHHATTGQSQPAPVPFPAPNARPPAPTPLPEPIGDAMPSGRMRGSLRGDQLVAARLEILSPPQQSIYAPLSRPPPPHLMTMLMQQPPTSS